MKGHQIRNLATPLFLSVIACLSHNPIPTLNSEGIFKRLANKYVDSKVIMSNTIILPSLNDCLTNLILNLLSWNYVKVVLDILKCNVIIKYNCLSMITEKITL